jgi:hypothetical protein
MSYDTHDEKNVVFAIIPAEPGWSVALFISAGCGQPAAFMFDPIIAWEIHRWETEYRWPAKRAPGERCVHRDVQPITCDPSFDENIANHWGIRRPDGKIEFPYDRSFDNEADALAYCAEEDAKLRARRRARACESAKMES